MGPPKIKLLAATLPASVEALSSIYGDAFEVRTVFTLADALEGLDAVPDLVTCNIHFAEGALFDLLRSAKAHPLTAKVPFIVIDATQDSTLPAIAQSIEIASTALGADEVVHVTLLRARLGDEAAFEAVRQSALGQVTRARHWLQSG